MLKGNSRSKGNKLFNYFRLLLQQSNTSGRTIVFYAMMSGIANAVLLSILNAAAYSAAYDTIDYRLVAMFAISMLMFYMTKRYILTKTTVIVEETINNVRIDLINKIRQSELQLIENVGASEIYTRITHDTNFISQTSAIIINSAQSAILIFFTLIYISFLSFPAFFITTLTLVLASSAFLIRQKTISKEIRQATKKETELFESLNHVLDGFKEIKMSRDKNDDLYDSLTGIADEGKRTKIRTGLRFAIGFMFSQTVFYLLMACIVFVVPQYSETYTDTLTRITAAILFIIGPIENVVSTIPLLSRSSAAVENIGKLEDKIDSYNQSNGVASTARKMESFETIEMREVRFRYTNEEGESTFESGPFNLKLTQGELSFIVGGNGSGKSTFLKILTGLYYPVSGEILVDGQIISPNQYQSYRELFSVIFTDFHLFDRVYGVEGVSDERVNKLIEQMGLKNKTSFENGRFTNIKLSTGQRKRIALIVALLENKPIYIFDEVAADQDPEFRKYFYEVLVRDFQKQGKTVILVSHDDKYFPAADRVLKMEFGRFIEDYHN